MKFRCLDHSALSLENFCSFSFQLSGHGISKTGVPLLAQDMLLPIGSVGVQPLLDLNSPTFSSRSVPSINELARLSPSEMFRGWCILAICCIRDTILASTGAIGLGVPHLLGQITFVLDALPDARFIYCQIGKIVFRFFLFMSSSSSFFYVLFSTNLTFSLHSAAISFIRTLVTLFSHMRHKALPLLDGHLFVCIFCGRRRWLIESNRGWKGGGGGDLLVEESRFLLLGN